MKFLRPAYLELAENVGDPVSTQKFYELLQEVEIPGEDFNKEVYLPGSTGQSKLYKQLLEFTGLDPKY